MNGGTYARAIQAGFSERQAVFMSWLKNEVMEMIVEREKPTCSTFKLFVITLAYYGIDMCFAVAGFLFGFGLEVKNWPVLIGLMIVARSWNTVFNRLLILRQKAKNQ